MTVCVRMSRVLGYTRDRLYLDSRPQAKVWRIHHFRPMDSVTSCSLSWSNLSSPLSYSISSISDQDPLCSSRKSEPTLEWSSLVASSALSGPSAAPPWDTSLSHETMPLPISDTIDLRSKHLLFNSALISLVRVTPNEEPIVFKTSDGLTWYSS